MHARELVELSALTALHGATLGSFGPSLNAAALTPYWAASKCRQDRWMRALKKPVLSPRPVMEEVLSGEILARVWSAVTLQYDRTRGTTELSPIAASVLAGHLQCRHRVLKRLTDADGLSMEDVVELNRLRRRSERWTDLLLGYLFTCCSSLEPDSTNQPGLAGELGFEVDRVLAFAKEMRSEKRLLADQAARRMMLLSLKSGFRKCLSDESPNGDLNRQIALSVLGCFQANSPVSWNLCETFETFELMESLWLMRLDRVAAHVQTLMDELDSLHLSGRR